jgi:hypothetical protein
MGGVESDCQTQRDVRVGTGAPYRRPVFGEGGVKVSAKAEFADFLQKRLSEGGLTYVEVAAAALLARVRGWNRRKKSKRQKTQRKPQLHVGDEIDQNGEKFTIAEVRFGNIISVKDAKGVIHQKEKS